jgi:hypothetical protein
MGGRVMTAEEVIDTKTDVPVRAEIVKEDTATNHIWKPISHSRFVDAMYRAFEAHDIKVLDSAFALNKKRDGKDGHLLVGGFQVQGDMLPGLPNDVSGVYEVFCRHANDMSMGIQLRAGVNLMVCTNGCMTGELIASRKHTKGFDIYEWANDTAIGDFVEDCQNQVDNINKLREVECSDAQANEIFMTALREGWMPAARVRDAAREWVEPIYNTDDFPLHTAWKVYGDLTHAATQCQADTQLTIVEKSAKLVNEICVPNLAAGVSF